MDEAHKNEVEIHKNLLVPGHELPKRLPNVKKNKEMFPVEKRTPEFIMKSLKRINFLTKIPTKSC